MVSVFINDESSLHQDYERWLEQLAPLTVSSGFIGALGVLVLALCGQIKPENERRNIP